ncbi:acetyltransferase [Bacillus sp. FJAT-27264]|uniref:CatB-related O-acetyltransferase n=1 Tax=Paenibacillus sp. (strain DSM 101736 / FJAT-27264) TaxID=1850362 RepID=UPI000807A62D|nr:CatB-related O-acetyltransferase [Bacillus sp. FJAT-27264]OBZ09823.1 acetyltransferase [Bacillus sp. FJAT-27264]
MMSIIKRYFNLFIFKRKWRKLNNHNLTTVGKQFPIDCVKVGAFTYGKLNVSSFGNKSERLLIGNLVSIGGEVNFILGGNHRYDCFSTYPLRKHILHKGSEAISKGPIIVGDDVWIGSHSVILSGVNIGRGTIIGAGSVVTKNIEPYSIVAGNPARVIKYRFDKQTIAELLKIDFNKIDKHFIENNEILLYQTINTQTLNDISIKIQGSTKL